MKSITASPQNQPASEFKRRREQEKKTIIIIGHEFDFYFISYTNKCECVHARLF